MEIVRDREREIEREIDSGGETREVTSGKPSLPKLFYLECCVKDGQLLRQRIRAELVKPGKRGLAREPQP